MQPDLAVNGKRRLSSQQIIWKRVLSKHGSSLWVCLCACLFVALFVCLFVWLFVCLFVGLLVRAFVCLFVCLFVRSCVCVCVCVFVSLVGWLYAKRLPKTHIVRENVEGFQCRKGSWKRRKIAFPHWHLSFYFFGSKVAPCDFGFEKKNQAKKARDCLGGPSVVFSNRNANMLEGENGEKKESPLGLRNNGPKALVLCSMRRRCLLKA